MYLYTMIHLIPAKLINWLISGRNQVKEKVNHPVCMCIFTNDSLFVTLFSIKSKLYFSSWISLKHRIMSH